MINYKRVLSKRALEVRETRNYQTEQRASRVLIKMAGGLVLILCQGYKDVITIAKDVAMAISCRLSQHIQDNQRSQNISSNQNSL